jgi:hypothetical protein
MMMISGRERSGKINCVADESCRCSPSNTLDLPLVHTRDEIRGKVLTSA